MLVAAAVAFGAPRAQAGASLDPFRPAGTAGRVQTLDPFRVAQAAAQPKPAAAPAAATPAGKTCRVDEDCPTDNICAEQSCQPIQVSTNILYLYYREGSFREILGLYWARRGPTGYTVLAPFWWHFWSPQSHDHVLAPFYWHFEDYARKSVVTVIVPGLPVSWSHEPGASSFGVWPIFYRSTKFGWAAPFLGTFKVTDPDSGRSFGAVAFLYWWRRTPQRALDLAFPLFVSTRTREGSFTYAVPLNFGWRNHDDENILALPFFYGNSHKTGGSFYTLLGYDRHEGSRRSGAALWLYWFADDEKQRTGYDVLFPLIWDFHGPDSHSTVVVPLVWHFRRGEDATSILFPVVWSFSSPRSNTTVAGPWVHLRRGDWRFDAVFPLWWSASDPGGGFRSLLPFFYWQRSGHGKRLTWLTPVGGYSRDDDAQSKTLALLPFFFYRRDPERELRIFSPLYVRHRSFDAYSTTHLLGALLYLRRDPQGSTTVLFPLIWHFRSEPAGATATAVLPFFAHRAGPRDESTFAGVFPLWLYWRRFSGGGWGGGLFPLAFFGSNGGRSHAIVFPLLWHFGSEQAATTVLAPVTYWHRDRHGYAGGVLPALTFFGARDGDSYAFQVPLFWRFASQRQGWSTTVTPIGYAHSDRDGWSLGVGPLLPILYLRSGQSRSHAVLFPLIWHFRDREEQRSTTVVGPYLHRSWGGETTDALFPLLHYRRGARPGGADETSFTLFPLLHYRRDADSRVLVTPLGASARGPRRSVGFLGPYFWYRDADLSVGLVPFLHADVTRQATGEHTRQWGPWFQIDAPGRTSRVLFPLFGRYQDAGETDTYVFPSYFRQRRSDGGEVDALLPLFWRSSGGGRTTTVVGPWYDRTAPGVHNTGLFPLYFHARNQQRSLTLVPLALFFHRHDRDGDRERLWFALLWHSREGESSSTAVFPLWWSGHRAGRSHAVLFPLYWRFSDAQAGTTQTAVGPFYWSSHGTGRTVGLLPLAWHAADAREGSGSNALLPLFYQSHGRDRFTLFTPIAGYRRALLSRLWYLWPAFFSNSVESRFGMVAPLWFSHTDKVTETTTTVVPPLLLVSRSTPESGIATSLLLFWRHHDIASSTTLGLPLYYDFHEYHLSRITVLLPLYFRYSREIDGSATTVAPLFYRHSTPTDITMVAFPLLWDWKRGDSRTTIVFPFFARWRRPGYASTYIFPTIYHREGLTPAGASDGTWRYVVAPFYDAAVKRPGDFQWEVLGGLFGHERIGRNRYLKLLFMTFETQPAPRGQTAWYGKPAPAPRRLAPRGLSMNRW